MNIRKENRDAWNDANNWSHRGLFGVYFAKNDSRILVPKAIPALGWTLNLAHPVGAGLLLIVIAASVGTAAALAVRSLA